MSHYKSPDFGNPTQPWLDNLKEKQREVERELVMLKSVIAILEAKSKERSESRGQE